MGLEGVRGRELVFVARIKSAAQSALRNWLGGDKGIPRVQIRPTAGHGFRGYRQNRFVLILVMVFGGAYRENGGPVHLGSVVTTVTFTGQTVPCNGDSFWVEC